MHVRMKVIKGNIVTLLESATCDYFMALLDEFVTQVGIIE